jgi:hypothetical protein
MVSIVADRKLFEELFPKVRELQVLASRYGINDIFQDNGGKLLQVLLALELDNIPNRQGNDAKNNDGEEFELKTINRTLTQRGFSTHHHLNPNIIAKYRKVSWFFAIYEGIELKLIYKLTPNLLEPYFLKWEVQYKEQGKDLNNPKIPIWFVQKFGQLYYKT